MNCKYCNCENCVIKKGKTITGKQRYFCKQCGKTFVLEEVKRFYPEELKKKSYKDVF